MYTCNSRVANLRWFAAILCVMSAIVTFREASVVESRATAAPAPKASVAEQAAAILAEIQLPAMQGANVDLNPGRLADDRSIDAKKLADYAADGPTFAEIRLAPDKFAKEHPLRVAVVEAVLEISKFGNDLPDMFRDPVALATLAEITAKHQRALALRQSILDEHREKLDEVAKNSQQEKSKRWQAHFDYLHAQLTLRMVWMSEYNRALGDVKTMKLPPLDEKFKQNGWRLRADERMLSGPEIRDLAKEAKKQLAQIAKDHLGTPWAVLANKQKEMYTGLAWEPVEVVDK